jgi:hypothetical protein
MSRFDLHSLSMCQSISHILDLNLANFLDLRACLPTLIYPDLYKQQRVTSLCSKQDYKDDNQEIYLNSQPSSDQASTLDVLDSLETNQCKECGLRFKNLIGMRQHMGKAHSKSEKKISCPTCDKKFKNKYAMKYHQKQVHLKSTRVICSICKTTIYNKYLLKKHLLKHEEHKHETQIE